MNDIERNELFKQMHNLSQVSKNIILTRTFGSMESAQRENKSFNIDYFFEIVQSQVEQEANNDISKG